MTTNAAHLPVCAAQGRWPTTRILFALAGTMTLLSASLAATVSPWWLLLTSMVGLNQLLFTAVGFCPASWVIDRVRRPDLGSVAVTSRET